MKFLNSTIATTLCVLIIIFVLGTSAANDPFIAVTSLDNITTTAGPTCMPKASKTPFNGYTTLLYVAPGADAIDTTVMFQYLSDRGATVKVWCEAPNDDKVVLVQGARPVYELTCDYTPKVIPDLSKVNAVLVPGGASSTAELRKAQFAPTASLQDWLAAAANRVLVMSGTSAELYITATNFKTKYGVVPTARTPFTGSAASAAPIINYISFPDVKAVGGYGTNATASYMLNTTNSTLVACRGGDVVSCITAVSEVAGFNETVFNATNCDGGVVPSVASQAKFASLTGKSPSTLPANNETVHIFTLPCKNKAGRNFCNSYDEVMIMAGHGSSAAQVMSLYRSVASVGMSPTIVCPDSAVGQGSKSGLIYLFDGQRPTYAVNCTVIASAARSYKWDIIAVPGGLPATHGVLRGDTAVQNLLTYGVKVVLLDTAVALIEPKTVLTSVLPSAVGFVPTTRYNDRDINNIPLMIVNSQVTTSEFPFAVLGKSTDVDTMMGMEEAMVVAQSRRILETYKHTSMDGLVLGVGIVGGIVVVALLNFVFKQRN
eukprot:PhM_4_TR6464/c0_g1_i1/m.22632